MAKEKKRIIVFKDGTRKEIVGENGKYWLCKDTQLRKNNRDIAEVVEEKAEKAEEPKPAKEKETKSKPKTKSKKQSQDLELDEGFEKIPDVSDLEV